MPKYKLNKDHYLHHTDRYGEVTPRHHLKGDVVDYEGPPSLSMTPVGKEAEERVAARNVERKAEHDRIRAGRSSSGWTPAMEKSMLKNLVGSQDDAKDQPVDAVMSRAKKRRAA